MKYGYQFRSVVLLGWLGGACVVGCNAEPAEVEQDPAVGRVEMELRLSDAVDLQLVSYVITGNGYSDEGSVDVERSRRLRFQVGGIPAGAGYTIQIQATDGGESPVRCEGSADFDVAARQATQVAVHLSCRLPTKAGSVVVSGDFNVCPVLDALSVLPSEVEVGGTLVLAASASDSDAGPDVMTFGWAAGGGELDATEGDAVSWLCTEPGDYVILALVSDGACSDSVEARVTCLEPVGNGGEARLVWTEVESSGGTPDDWAELYNAGDAVADLSGYTLRDNDDSHVYAVPSGTTVQPGAYLVLEGYDFGLGSSDSVRLFDADGELVIEYSWEGHALTTYGRCPDVEGEFGLTTAPTKGAANDCSPVVYLNEVESNGGDPGDWVEIYNAGVNVADLSGWTFSDDDDTHVYVLPTGTVIAPGDYAVLETADFGFGLGGADSARLFDTSGELVDSYSWADHAQNTYGRCPDGGGAFEDTRVATKGAANACTVTVRVNEIVSTGGDPGDWVEFVNRGEADTDISGWSFLDDNDTHVYVFPEGSLIPAGGYLVVDETVFGFGLGNGDAARLFDESGVLVDGYTYAEHAATSWGRCPDGEGDFVVTRSVTQGGANDCALDPDVTSPWPGSDAVQSVDPANAFPENLSGLHYQPATSESVAVLWGALNGPSKIYRLEWNGAEWAPAAGEWAAGKSLTYPDGTGAPDTEGVSKADWDEVGIYVATERNNDASSVSKLSVLRFDETAAGETLTATHEWDLTSLLPAVGANRGLEGITWLPDTYLVEAGLADALTGLAYDPTNYADHGNGLFVVGVEETGDLHVLALDMVAGAPSLIQTISSGHPAVMGLEFDRDTHELWAACDNTCNNEATVLAVDSTGFFTGVARFAPPGALPNSNNEGLAFATEAECVDGQKAAFWSDDSNFDSHALRQGARSCRGK